MEFRDIEEKKKNNDSSGNTVTSQVLEYFNTYSQSENFSRYLRGSSKNVIPSTISEIYVVNTKNKIEGIGIDESSSNSSIASNRKLEWDNGADIGYKNAEKIHKSLSLPILNNNEQNNLKSNSEINKNKNFERDLISFEIIGDEYNNLPLAESTHYFSQNDKQEKEILKSLSECVQLECNKSILDEPIVFDSKQIQTEENLQYKHLISSFPTDAYQKEMNLSELRKINSKKNLTLKKAELNNVSDNSSNNDKGKENLKIITDHFKTDSLPKTARKKLFSTCSSDNGSKSVEPTSSAHTLLLDSSCSSDSNVSADKEFIGFYHKPLKSKFLQQNKPWIPSLNSPISNYNYNDLIVQTFSNQIIPDKISNEIEEHESKESSFKNFSDQNSSENLNKNKKVDSDFCDVCNNGEIFIKCAKNERKQQLRWIQYEIDHLSHLKKLLENTNCYLNKSFREDDKNGEKSTDNSEIGVIKSPKNKILSKQHKKKSEKKYDLIENETESVRINSKCVGDCFAIEKAPEDRKSTQNVEENEYLRKKNKRFFYTCSENSGENLQPFSVINKENSNKIRSEIANKKEKIKENIDDSCNTNEKCKPNTNDSLYSTITDVHKKLSDLQQDIEKKEKELKQIKYLVVQKSKQILQNIPKENNYEKHSIKKQTETKSIGIQSNLTLGNKNNELNNLKNKSDAEKCSSCKNEKIIEITPSHSLEILNTEEKEVKRTYNKNKNGRRGKSNYSPIKKKSIAYTLILEEQPKRKKRVKNKKINQLDEVKMKIQTWSTCSETTSKENSSSSNKTDRNSQEIISDTQKNKTLQDHLIENRPKFIESAEERRRCLNELVTIRDQYRDKYKQLLTLAGAPLTSLFDQIFPEQKKIFSSTEIRRITYRKYKKLPEVKQKLKKNKDEQIKIANRVLLNIFTKKLKDRVLNGDINLSLRSRII